MHPDDAAERGIAEGDEIRIFNALGEVRCTAALGSWIRRGTVSLPKGIWRKHTANGYTGTVARARHADRYRRRRVLQRRARAGRAGSVASSWQLAVDSGRRQPAAAAGCPLPAN